jgi:NAD(P)-dependent dehydrogenase (short-subunit alcohol dehydrogenase family)
MWMRARRPARGHAPGEEQVSAELELGARFSGAGDARVLDDAFAAASRLGRQAAASIERARLDERLDRARGVATRRLRRRRSRRRGPAIVAAAAAAVGLLAGLEVLSRLRAEDLSGRVVLITGGSRGLGLLLAREFGRQDCRIVICARDEGELERARADLAGRGVEVLASRCDVSKRAEVERLLGEARARFGGIDVLVNNAGVIQVGPLETMSIEDFEEALGVMFWGTVYPTLGVLPEMRARGFGRIVNITSIGGRAAVPHLVPYVAAKFAATGFSESLRAELAGTGVRVTTVVPGLMRTGSYLNAKFKGHAAREATWFSLGAALPGVSMGAERAARRIVLAARRGEPDVILTLPAQIAARAHGLMPGIATRIAEAVDRVLPPSDGANGRAAAGYEAIASEHPRLFDLATTLGRSAARRFNQLPDASEAERTSARTGE